MEKLKSALAFLFKITTSLDTALEDGKINFFTEGIPLATNLVGAPAFIQDLKASWPELKSAIEDDDKLEELIEYFKEEFELSDEKAEAVVEAVVDGALTIAEAIQDVVAVVKN